MSVFFALLCRIGYNTADVPQDLMSDWELNDDRCSEESEEHYLLTAWSRVLLEKLTGFQLVKNIPAFYGTRKLITVLTSARHLSLS